MTDPQAVCPAKPDGAKQDALAALERLVIPATPFYAGSVHSILCSPPVVELVRGLIARYGGKWQCFECETECDSPMTPKGSFACSTCGAYDLMPAAVQIRVAAVYEENRLRAETAEASLSALRERVVELTVALAMAQFDCRGRCPVCAGWNVGPYGETDKVHTKDCPVGIALAHPAPPDAKVTE